MIIYPRERPDWIHVRQILSLALLYMEPVTIPNGMAFIKSNPEYAPLLSDIAALAASAGAGRIITENESIIYEPQIPASWDISFKSGKFSSISELILFLAPSLFMRDFRTVLNISGATHPSPFYPVNFINETLFSFLERSGFYAGIVLKRYGFTGSGGGAVEARVYPSENKAPRDFTFQERIDLKKARIIFSGPAIDFVEKIKALIKTGLGLDEGLISIIEVLDCDGMGISVLFYLDSHNESFPSPVQCIVPYGAEVYNSNGDLVFDEEESLEKLKGKMEYVNFCIAENILPEPVFREAALYLYLSGVREISGNYGREYGELVEEYGRVGI